MTTTVAHFAIDLAAVLDPLGKQAASVSPSAQDFVSLRHDRAAILTRTLENGPT